MNGMWLASENDFEYALMMMMLKCSLARRAKTLVNESDSVIVIVMMEMYKELHSRLRDQVGRRS